MKICNRCSVEYELDFFRKDKRGKYGVRSICKNCDNNYYQKYYENNFDRMIQTVVNYRKTEKWYEVRRLSTAKYRCLIRTNSDNTVNYEATLNILKKQNFKCPLCSLEIKDRKTRHLDHIIPISKWWHHTIRNVQWLCCKCNLRKSDNI